MGEVVFGPCLATVKDLGSVWVPHTSAVVYWCRALVFSHFCIGLYEINVTFIISPTKREKCIISAARK